jgi:hypothetical protein
MQQIVCSCECGYAACANRACARSCPQSYLAQPADGLRAHGQLLSRMRLKHLDPQDSAPRMLSMISGLVTLPKTSRTPKLTIAQRFSAMALNVFCYETAKCPELAAKRTLCGHREFDETDPKRSFLPPPLVGRCSELHCAHRTILSRYDFPATHLSAIGGRADSSLETGI